MKRTCIFLCDESGVMAEPWAAAGFDCYCVDVAHGIRNDREQNGVRFVWGDVRSWTPPAGLDIAFMAAFPPCTHLAASGARDHRKKGGWALADSLQIFDSCRMACVYSGAPYCIENPVGRLSTHREPPTTYFDPCDYAGYLPDPAAEAYTKKTGLWCGGGFVVPERLRVEPALGSLIIKMAPGEDRDELRSKTPRGFAIATFRANVERCAA